MRLANTTKLATVLTALAIFSTGLLSAQTQQETNQLSIHISTNSTSFVSGAEIDVNIDLTNNSSNDIKVTRGQNAPELAGFTFIISRSGVVPDSPVQMTSYLWTIEGMQAPRTSVKEPDLGYLGGLGSYGGGLLVEAGKTVRFVGLLNNLYDLSAPGSYLINVRKYPYGINSGIFAIDQTLSPIESNTITVTVTDPPPPAISLDLSAPSQRFPAGSEVEADLAVTNISNLPVVLPFDPDHPSAEQNGFKFTGLAQRKSPNDVVQPKHLFLWREFNHQYPFHKTVQPGQTIHYSVSLSTLLDISASGAYTIEASGLDPVTHLSVKSNALTIAVE